MYRHEIETRIAAIAAGDAKARTICEVLFGLYQEPFLERMENLGFTADQLVKAYEDCGRNPMRFWVWLEDLTGLFANTA